MKFIFFAAAAVPVCRRHRDSAGLSLGDWMARFIFDQPHHRGRSKPIRKVSDRLQEVVRPAAAPVAQKSVDQSDSESDKRRKDQTKKQRTDQEGRRGRRNRRRCRRKRTQARG